MVARSLPLTALLLILLAASAVPATAGGKHSGAARMVVIIRRGPGTTTRAGGGGAAGARASNEWRHGRRLEDVVATEQLMIGGLLGAGDGDGIGYGALEKDRPGCQSSSQCAAQGGGSYTRGCTYKDHCPH